VPGRCGMRRPTDAQARLLMRVHDRTIAEHGDRRYLGDGYITSERVGYGLGRFRRATRDVCVREGWLTVDEDGEAHVTQDGQIVLGLWREQQLKRPPAPMQALEGEDREVVLLAEHAVRLGYRLVPSEYHAKQRSRRLSRLGWVHRGWVGSSTMSVVPTAIGRVEVAPELADSPLLHGA